MASAKIVYASMTGNNEEIAGILESAFEKLDVDVETLEVSQAEVDDFDDADICVVTTYTYGDGEVPDEAVDFFEDLEDADLSGKIYGCCGSGDTFYDTFGGAIDQFAAAFEKTGAKKGADIVKVDLSPEDEDTQKLEDFVKQLVEAQKNA